MLVEAAWSITTQPGPLRAFFNRIKEKRGKQVAAIATARKLAVLIWHMLSKQENYPGPDRRSTLEGTTVHGTLAAKSGST